MITDEKDQHSSLDVHYSGELSGSGRAGIYEVKMFVNRNDGAVKLVNTVIVDGSVQRLDVYGRC